jgi:hypothetical protein
VTKTPATPSYPAKRPKKHENGILTFTQRTQGWQPWPTPEQARTRFDELVSGWRANLPPSAATTVRLIVNGEVVEEVELRGERGCGA